MGVSGSLAVPGSGKPSNIFVLTTGLSGSSVATGLIAKAGYWVGERTEFKSNSTGHYETFENSHFVELNNRLVKLSGIKFDNKFWYQPDLSQRFAKLADEIDLHDYKDFVSKCANHQPWVLKDPKLWVTLDFWLKLFSTQDISCVVIRRSSENLWLSQALKRIIYDFKFLQQSEAQAHKKMIRQLQDCGINYTNILFESLIDKPEACLLDLNNVLKINLTMTDWRNVYQPVSKSKASFGQWVKARLIYLKNYTERIK
jgi:hypothetical protein